MASADIELLAGLEGGGKLSGKSGQKIQNQLNNIIGHINKDPLKVKVDIDKKSLAKMKQDLNSLTKDALAEAAKLRAAYSGIFPFQHDGSGTKSGGGSGGGNKNPYAETIKYNKALARTESLLKQVNSAKEKWTAAEKGQSSLFYKGLEDQSKGLEDLVQRLLTAKISLEDFELVFNMINAGFKQSSEVISSFGENVKVGDALKKETDALEKNRKKIFDLEQKYSNWSAAGAKGSTSFKAYEGLDGVIRKLRNLDVELSSGAIGLEEFEKRFRNLSDSADGFIRAIKRAGEDRASPLKLSEGVDGYIDALEEIQKKRFELQQKIESWGAAGEEGSITKEAYDDLKTVITLFDDLESEIGDGTLTFAEYKNLLKEITHTANEYVRIIKGAKNDHPIDEKLTKDSSGYLTSLNKINDAIKTAKTNQEKWSAAEGTEDVGEQYSDIEKRITQLRNLREELKRGELTLTQFNAKFDQIKEGLTNDYGAIFEADLDYSKTEELEIFQKQLKELDTAIEQNEQSLKEWSKAKTGVSAKDYAGIESLIRDLEEMRKALLRTGHSLDDFDDRMAKIRKSSAEFGAGIKNANEDTMTLGDKVVDIVRKYGETIDVMDVVFKAREYAEYMISAVTDIDTAMTELRKVTDETSATYSAFLEEATVRAQDLGSSVSDVISASADFARLGHDLGDASALADAALVYKNVGDGIEDIEVASSSLISTMQAFGVQAKDAMSIVDSFNAVGNNFAISSAGIGDALLNSAASLAAAGNDIHESVALIAAANTTIQDPGRVGTALKTLSMYLRAAKTEAEDAGISTEGMAESVSQLRDELMALTGDRVDIMSDAEAGSYKSTVEILRDLSKVWDDLSDTSRTNITELIGGGVRNANIISALMNNFSIVEDAMAVSAKSAGSALAENEKYLDSIIGKTEQFKAATEALSTAVFDTDTIKTVVDLGTGLVQMLTGVVKNFGPIIGLFTAGRVIDTISNFKDLAKDSKVLKGIKTVLDGFGLSGGKLAGGSKLTLLSNTPAIS